MRSYFKPRQQLLAYACDKNHHRQWVDKRELLTTAASHAYSPLDWNRRGARGESPTDLQAHSANHQPRRHSKCWLGINNAV